MPLVLLDSTDYCREVPNGVGEVGVLFNSDQETFPLFVCSEHGNAQTERQRRGSRPFHFPLTILEMASVEDQAMA